MLKKAQSAMEYLMTYGWGILIMAIVIGSLYGLGVFNSFSLTPRAQPGSCQVIRPYGYGTGTSTSLSLGGVCTNELPEYVTNFGGSGTITVPATLMPNGNQQRTIVVWINPNNEVGNHGIMYYGGVNCVPAGAVFGLILQGSNLYLWGSCNDVNSYDSIPLNTWSFIAVNYTGTEENMFYDGNPINTQAYSSTACNSINCSYAYIGGENGWWGGQFSGEIADLQIYNTSLSANAIKALYLEGIGGDPIDLHRLVGWWPLNGNANDYSGNSNGSETSGISYTSTWINTYTAP